MAYPILNQMNRDVATSLAYNNSTKKQSTRREMKDIYVQ